MNDTKLVVLMEAVVLCGQIEGALSEFVNPDNVLDLPDDLAEKLSALTTSFREFNEGVLAELEQSREEG